MWELSFVPVCQTRPCVLYQILLYQFESCIAFSVRRDVSAILRKDCLAVAIEGRSSSYNRDLSLHLSSYAVQHPTNWPRRDYRSFRYLSASLRP